MRWINYVYIDESGDLGKFGSKYFTVAAIVVEEPKALARIIKRLRQRKLEKSIKELPEIKANNSKGWIREYVLGKVREAQCSIFSVVVKKDDLRDDLFGMQDRFYNRLCSALLGKLNLDHGRILITVDKKYTNTLLRADFDAHVKNELKRGNKELAVEILHLPSCASNELQVADFVAWSINRKFNTGDDSYYRLIDEKIINKEDMLWKK